MKKPSKYWVLKDRNSNIFYAESNHIKYGKIQTICDNVKVAKRFRTKNSAESKAFGKYQNFIPYSVLYIPKDYHIGKETKILFMDDMIKTNEGENNG